MPCCIPFEEAMPPPTRVFGSSEDLAKGAA